MQAHAHLAGPGRRELELDDAKRRARGGQERGSRRHRLRQRAALHELLQAALEPALADLAHLQRQAQLRRGPGGGGASSGVGRCASQTTRR